VSMAATPKSLIRAKTNHIQTQTAKLFAHSR
jgi:hypothetical protein